MKLEELKEDTDTSMGDFIISKFEAGKITFAQAKQELKDKGLEIYIHELNMADELLKDDGKTLH